MGITSVEWRRGLSSQNNARFGSTSGLSCLRGNLRKEGVGELDGEASFADFRGICGGDAGELRADVVDDVEIAVGAVVVAQAEIGAYGLGIGGIHLQDAG